MGRLLGPNSWLFLQDLGQGKGQSDIAKGFASCRDPENLGISPEGGALWCLAEVVPSPAEGGQPLYDSREALEEYVLIAPGTLTV